MRQFIQAAFTSVLLVAGGSLSVRPAAAELTVSVDLSERRMEVHIDGSLHSTYEVAVGKRGHETPTGDYRLSRVIWNPAWVPPDRPWARGATRKAPGAPNNPMGRVKIYFAGLYYIHGTNDDGTIGQPVSHGCIRMRNSDAMELARLVMEHGGASRSQSWYDVTRERRSVTREVTIPSAPRLVISQ